MRAYLNNWPVSKSLTRVYMHRLSHTQACTHTGFLLFQWERIRAMIPSLSLSHTVFCVGITFVCAAKGCLVQRSARILCVCVRLGVCVSE